MAIAAEGDVIMERFVFRQLDGQKITLGEVEGELTAMLLPYWEAGSLKGETPGEAFNVNVGPTVNTPATEAAGELHAVLSLKMSEMAEVVDLAISKVPSQEVV